MMGLAGENIRRRVGWEFQNNHVVNERKTKQKTDDN